MKDGSQALQEEPIKRYQECSVTLTRGEENTGKVVSEADITPPADLPEDPSHSYDPSKTFEIINSVISDGETHDAPPEDFQTPGARVSSTGSRLYPDNETQEPLTPLPELTPEQRAHRVQRDTTNPFKLSALVGKGGFGEVWQGVQVNLDRVVAIKRLRADKIAEASHNNPTARAYLEHTFRHEALMTANLDHPNIMPMHDLGLDNNGLPQMAMKYSRGVTWKDVIDKDIQTYPASELLAKHVPILVQVAQAVTFAHARGVLHRDLKPAQVIVGEFGEVLLADWGLAIVYDFEKFFDTEKVTDKDFFSTPETANNPAGTPTFMAPEQTEKNAQNVGPWTDIYLLGGTLYYLLTGRAPHEAESTREAYLKAHLGMVTPPEQVVKYRDVPGELSKLAMKALEPEAKDRIDSAQEFLEELKGYLSGATRRRESLQITEMVGFELERAEGDYQTYSECMYDLSRASFLWGENPVVPDLMQLCRAEWARAALKNDDLVLARIQVDSLTKGPTRQELEQKVKEAEVKYARRMAQRHWFVSVGVIMVMVIITLVSIFYKQLSTQNAESVRERDSARTAVANSQSVLNLLIDDFGDSIKDEEQLKRLVTYGNKILEYLNQIPEDELTLEIRMEKAASIRNLASLQQKLGNLETALELQEQYQDLAKIIIMQDSAGKVWRSNLVESYLLMALINEEQGQIDEKQNNLEGAMLALVETISASEPAATRNAVKNDVYASMNIFGKMRREHNLVNLEKLTTLGRGTISQILSQPASPEEAIISDENESPPFDRRSIELLVMSDIFSWIGDQALKEWDATTARLAYEEAHHLRGEIDPSSESGGLDPVWLSLALNESYMDLGRALEAEKNPTGATFWYRRSIDLLMSEWKRTMEDTPWIPMLASAHQLHGQALLGSGMNEEAISTFDITQTTLKDFSRLFDEEDLMKRRLEVALLYIQAATSAENVTLAEQVCVEALRETNRSLKAGQTTPAFQQLADGLIEPSLSLVESHSESGSDISSLCSATRELLDSLSRLGISRPTLEGRLNALCEE